MSYSRHKNAAPLTDQQIEANLAKISAIMAQAPIDIQIWCICGQPLRILGKPGDWEATHSETVIDYRRCPRP